MKKNMLSLLLFICVTASSLAQYTPQEWFLRIHDTGRFVSGAIYFASACRGYEKDGAILKNSTNPFSFYFCDNSDFTTNVMGCPNGLAFNPSILGCDYRSNIDLSEYPNFPWEEYP
ncbi:chitin binding peritrophin-A-like protein [Flavobacterium sp. 9]|uniref:chitin binding peritrophin-A domain-containing protein n=1 Tax=Flavobacterium sp. 9 TaxID=2035198 RepID=UPI000C1A5540|nr:chitin binding peritrophin-A domain-containing protein [Flavobacterium sp. 9]PIF34308.1 chitin binding peritrophin-A-like protein [Flavobacterium sp. 9]